ncbi:hypothetical protein EDF81_1253 [Enterobacter sp. BIGb0383]|uniref:hypothetical protein n=1 Tax=unclassified Enterobacter TaxID=2608935 RepID=UPI000F4AC7F2|nr:MULTISPECIES: hypothetical protein [unclassified Enterobacter]ROP62745.1 hypothetical protein EDF81_1253 [Enterobacter sp. BIGb0383]ROS12906.1 hypothetical protein EC848_1255 [Enterobacter sp. BIGb0359]
MLDLVLVLVAILLIIIIYRLTGDKFRKIVFYIIGVIFILGAGIVAYSIYSQHQSTLYYEEKDNQYGKDTITFLNEMDTLIEANLTVNKDGGRIIKNDKIMELASNLIEARHYRTSYGSSFMGNNTGRFSDQKKSIHLDTPIDGVSDVVVYYADFLPYDFGETAVKAGWRGNSALIRFYTLDGKSIFDGKTQKWTRVYTYAEAFGE